MSELPDDLRGISKELSGGYPTSLTRAADELERLDRENAALREALQPIAKAYPNDPGTSDLYNEQPVTITLGDVRRVWRALALLEKP